MLARATRNINVRAVRLIFIGVGYLRAADHIISELLVIVNVQVIVLLARTYLDYSETVRTGIAVVPCSSEKQSGEYP
jgi:hypothetical protein